MKLLKKFLITFWNTKTDWAMTSWLIHWPLLEPVIARWRNNVSVQCSWHDCERCISLYNRGHQPFWNCELLLVYQLMRRDTSLMHTSEIKILLNLHSIILVLIFVNMKTLIMLMLFLEKTRGRPTWYLQATWCPRAPRWWPLLYNQWRIYVKWGPWQISNARPFH